MTSARQKAMIVAMLSIGAALAALILLSVVSGHSAPHVANPVQRSIDGVRERHIVDLADESYDDGWETCLAAGLRSLAHRLAVAPNPSSVAKAFSSGFDSAFRRGPYMGCRDALLAGQGGSGGQR